MLLIVIDHALCDGRCFTSTSWKRPFIAVIRTSMEVPGSRLPRPVRTRRQQETGNRQPILQCRTARVFPRIPPAPHSRRRKRVEDRRAGDRLLRIARDRRVAIEKLMAIVAELRMVAAADLDPPRGNVSPAPIRCTIRIAPDARYGLSVRHAAERPWRY